MKTEVSNYQQQAIDFAEKHGVKLEILNEKWGKHFDDDKQERSIFKFKLTRTLYGHTFQYTFDFGQSIVKVGVEPALYDVLSCLHDINLASAVYFQIGIGIELTRGLHDGREIHDDILVLDVRRYHFLFCDISRYERHMLKYPDILHLFRIQADDGH